MSGRSLIRGLKGFQTAGGRAYRWPSKNFAISRLFDLRFAAGTLLYNAETSAGFGDRLFAVPMRALWETA
ncbi:MAG: hypothetical protein KAY24_02570 [Candidatus Eisenbacteria sp.]|nr:hypothetical protein [Candidatus Eisenbacteria bacterium]